MGSYDMSSGMALLGGLGLLAWLFFTLFGILVLVLWTLMPFAVFAIRRRVDEQQAVLQRIERHLADLASREPRAAQPVPPTQLP